MLCGDHSQVYYLCVYETHVSLPDIFYHFSLSVVQIRALVCLNNITASMDVELLGGVNALGQLWNTLFSLTYGNECKWITRSGGMHPLLSRSPTHSEYQFFQYMSVFHQWFWLENRCVSIDHCIEATIDAYRNKLDWDRNERLSPSCIYVRTLMR